jgi:hypothetical protein
LPFFLLACAGVDPLSSSGEPVADGTGGPVEDAGAGPDQPFPWAEDRIFDIALDIPPDSVDRLARNGPFVPATFHYGDLTADVGVRLKGSTSFQKLDRKPELKISFDAFEPGARFLGLERLTLNSMWWDNTMLHEATAYHLFADIGVPAPRHSYARVAINGEPYGLFGIVETLDEHFLKRVMPHDADGNLYDTAFNLADLTDAGQSQFVLQNGDPTGDGSDLRDLVADLDTRPILDVLRDRFDVDEALGFLAVDLAAPNWDGYSRNTNNFLLYHATNADRWYILPWGQDSTFHGTGSIFEGVRGRIAAACEADAECTAALEERVRDMLDVWQSHDLHGWAAEKAAMIEADCQADTRKHYECDTDELVNALVSRLADVGAEVGE